MPTDPACSICMGSGVQHCGLSKCRGGACGLPCTCTFAGGDEQAEVAYWEAVVEKSIHDAVVRKAEAAAYAHIEALEARALGTGGPGVQVEMATGGVVSRQGARADVVVFDETHAWLTPEQWSKATSGVRTNIAPVTLKAGDSVTLNVGSINLTSD